MFFRFSWLPLFLPIHSQGIPLKCTVKNKWLPRCFFGLCFKGKGPAIQNIFPDPCSRVPIAQ
jgi:hypothetical protein